MPISISFALSHTPSYAERPCIWPEYCTVYLFTIQLSLVFIVLIHGAVARLSDLGFWLIPRWFTHLHMVTHLSTNQSQHRVHNTPYIFTCKTYSEQRRYCFAAVRVSVCLYVCSCTSYPLSSDRQHLSYDACLEVRVEIIRTILCYIVY